MATDAPSSSWIDFQTLNPDDLIPEDQSCHQEMKPMATCFRFDLSILQLPGMRENCTDTNEGFPASMLEDLDPVKLPECVFYPFQPDSRSRLFCCRVFEGRILDSDFTFKELHIELHKKLHRAIDDMQLSLKTTGLMKLFERIAVTLEDGRAADVVIDHGLNARTNSYSNAAGEFMLSESLLKDTFSFKETTDSVQYSGLQPVTPYFLRLIQEYSAVEPGSRIVLDAIPGNDKLFMIRTGVQCNRAFLPLLFCIGMTVGCPFDCRMSSKYWIFTKEVLYMLEKVFGIFDMNMSGILFNLLSEDILRCSKCLKLYCRPLWRVLISIERTPREPECLSHIPRTAATMVELSRFAEIVARSETLKGYEEEDIEKERQRILNIYETREKGRVRVRDEYIVAVLMYERKHLIEELPQFIPKLKWIHKRKRLMNWNDENVSEDY